MLSLRLARKRHVVEIVLGVKRDFADPMPQVWWEDRALHPEARGYAKVLWSGEVTYAGEESIAVPRVPRYPELAMAIGGHLALLRGAIEAWYVEAESAIAKKDA